MAASDNTKGFPNSLQNRKITIEGNHIDDSYLYAIFVNNADGVKIEGNAIGSTAKPALQTHGTWRRRILPNAIF